MKIISILLLASLAFAMSHANEIPVISEGRNYTRSSTGVELSSPNDKPRSFGFMYLQEKALLPSAKEDRRLSFSFTIADFQGGSMRISMSPESGEVWTLHNAILILVETTPDGPKFSLFLKNTASPGYGKLLYSGVFERRYPISVWLEFDRENYSIRFSQKPGTSMGAADNNWGISAAWDSPLTVGFRIYNNFSEPAGKSTAIFSAIGVSTVKPWN
jgi:hypothetical protein